MILPHPFRRALAALSCLILFSASAGALAQTESDIEPIPEDLETSTEVFEDWTVICVESSPRSCRMAQRLNVDSEDGPGQLLQVTLMRSADGVVMGMDLPLGLDLRAGVVVRFDENEEIPLPYTTCYNSGCQVVAQLAPEHLAEFEAGSTMQVGFRALGQEETLVAELSLSGSSSALAALPEPVQTAE